MEYRRVRAVSRRVPDHERPPARYGRALADAWPGAATSKGVLDCYPVPSPTVSCSLASRPQPPTSMPRDERLERGTDRRIEKARIMLRIGQLPVVLQPDKPAVAR